MSNETVTSPYDDRLDKLDPEGNLGPGQNRSPNSEGSIKSPNDSATIPNSISKEASPMKEPASKKAAFMGKMSMFSKVVSARVDQAKDKADALKYQGTLNKSRCFTLLIIADQNIDWPKWFRGRKIHTDWDIRVEQCEFKDLTVSASSEEGISAGIVSYKSGNRTVNLLKPDFLLIRQDPRDAGEDFKSVLLGFQYGQVPSINSLQSIYNFQDKPWVYAHLLGLQKKLGKENFPVIEQCFYQNHRDIVHKGQYPCVFKIGHAHGGLGKVKVDTEEGFQDLTGVVAVSTQYCTVEEFVDAYCDLHIYKIGTKYKALMRKSLSEGWKTNVGESNIQEVPVQDKYKVWIDEVSALFGGLLLCSLEAVVDIAGKEYIIEVNDCAMGLLGDGQDEDRKNMADVVLKEMETHCKPPSVPPPKPPPPVSNAGSRPDSSLSNAESVGKDKTDTSETGSIKRDDAKVKENPKKDEDPKPKKDTSREKDEKPKKESKRDRSEEKARKEARRQEKEAKRETERKKAEEEERLRKEEEERLRKEEAAKKEAERLEEERKKKMTREESEESEPSIVSRQKTDDSDGSESDSASESSNASSTIVRKTEKNSVAKPKIKDEKVPDTMQDLQATFSGIFGEKK
eukprot:GFUD01025064.1.p1 GENE.GFUD01025064.1~~GFUD01025064.1.p1  ORF type:complete len:627 (+),score=199.24 GFUD01025064.1:96-1976(+)